MPDSILPHALPLPVHLQCHLRWLSHLLSSIHIPFSLRYFLTVWIKAASVLQFWGHGRLPPAFAATKKADFFLPALLTGFSVRLLSHRCLETPAGRYHVRMQNAWHQFPLPSSIPRTDQKNRPPDAHGDDGIHCGMLHTISGSGCLSYNSRTATAPCFSTVPATVRHCHSLAARHPPSAG